jgi:GNAT superfamily N-acetyltransferase
VSTPVPITVRPATSEDLPVLLAMRDDLNDLERAGCPHAPIARLTLEEFQARWGHTIEDPGYCWRIVEVEDQPVGYGLIYLTTPARDRVAAFLHWAYLAPGSRQQGLGKVLVEEMLDWARSRGAAHVELRYIDGNDMAGAFWTKMGFQSFARQCVLSLGPSGRP